MVENLNGATWNDLIATLPDPHLLQTWEWAQVKTRYGWILIPQIWRDDGGKPVAAAMVLKRTIPIRGFAKRMSVLYLPKGPLMDWENATLRIRVLDDLQALAKKQGSIFIKIDPDVVLGRGIPGTKGAVDDGNGHDVLFELKQQDWRFSTDQIQFRNTVMIDLSPPEEDILARMKQKTRYNIRLASKKGIKVRVGTVDDLPMLYRMYAETSLRDGFVIRDEGYYYLVWKNFMESSYPHAEPLIAVVNGEQVAALFLFRFAKRAYYLHGMSRAEHREKMPNYLLQWEAIRRAKAAGCSVYDLWGAPDRFDEEDKMWGVFRFKDGFGGEVIQTLGAWDYPSNPFFYRLYTKTLPYVINIMRAMGKSRTRHSIDADSSEVMGV
ncbi:MAG: aminoacyltransferase [Anaerolineales bacterium]|nr:aminoacyltransferase [Anaerolineales bacterium]